ncbi:LPS O-antigen chain length determinant protein WzzB [Pollutimonas harenae]|uniref:LPS O-antigen chain length determinant protein WzzB n=1 Tax=Pollutimonas harenae TaxID=657015 RepID=A0A853GU60_9BURK|nr:Wzz/FepE/Etk N-terminal domain-containing protein [Pollutimonas harenae]NYT84326.1 LPS O-antigen chain length determinant protein WzzB [Pollutimonas harenae]TEA73272.1 hypothetical protein ERD84_05000 [Pollutimonas harenae]
MQSTQENNKNINTSDEIDLRELLLTLWSAKVLIIAVTLLTTCAAAVYVFLSTPIYEAHVQALPPTQGGLAAYNMANQLSGSAVNALTQQPQQEQTPDNAIEALSTKDAYKVFLRHADSSSLRQAFFKNTYLAEYGSPSDEGQRQQLWKDFNKSLNIKRPQKPTDASLLTLSWQGADPQLIAQWANQYVNMAISAAQHELLQNLQSAVQLRLDSTQAQIDTLREVALIDQQSNMAQLKEALELAESIGLEDPPPSGNLITSYTGSTSYLRGAKALRAELALITSRQDHDPYLSELPNLLRTQTLLKSIDTHPSVSVATIDESATAPIDPIKPRKALVLVLGVVVGGMLGILAALLRGLFRKTA